MKNTTRALIILLVPLIAVSCKKKEDDTNYTVDTTAEMGQQVADAMASVDESGGSTSGTISWAPTKADERMFARLAHEEATASEYALGLLLPKAEATACSATTFTSCTSNQKTRDFTNCTFGSGGVMGGSVVLTFVGTGASSCTLPSTNDLVSRVPNYVLTGLRGATFSVAATTSGQIITRTGATTFTFSNAGIRRTFTTPKGTTILDVTTTTNAPLTITGNSRNTRTITNPGSSPTPALVVTNNLSGVSCNVTPSSVSWTSGCNCPTSGSWTGSCTDATTFTVAFTSTCGQATVTKGTDSSTVTMDRCN